MHPYLVFYDGHCRLCTDSVRMLRQMDPSEEVQFINIQNAETLAQYPQIDPIAAQGQMHVITPDGRVFGGFDAIVALIPAFPSLRVFGPILRGPVMRQLGEKVYRWVAKNRYRIAGTNGCQSGVCKLH